MHATNNHIPIYDLHTHSSFSVDSQSSIQAMCQRALELGLRAIAITDHVDNNPADAGFGFFRPDDYLAEIDRCRNLYGDRLEILSGVEVAEIHRFRIEAEKLLRTYQFDLVIGSLHWIGDVMIYDDSPYFTTRTIDQACEDYFIELKAMCLCGGFDVLGHMDFVKRHLPDPNYDIRRYESLVRPVLKILIQKGIALEINTSALFKPVNETAPGRTVVKWYREMGGELLTIGSDAHAPSRLAAGWDLALDIAKNAGLANLTLFRKRAPVRIPLGND